MVVECQHCAGTTLCQYAVHFCDSLGIDKGESFFTPDREVFEHWLRCQRCGDGYHRTERRKSFDQSFDVTTWCGRSVPSVTGAVSSLFNRHLSGLLIAGIAELQSAEPCPWAS